MTKSFTPSELSGVTGTLKIVFAIPTDDPRVWRLRNGSITFENGFTTEIEVEDGHIAYTRGDRGLNVKYGVFRRVSGRPADAVGDVAMMTCENGRVTDSADVAFGVKVLLPNERQRAVSTSAAAADVS